MAILAYLDKLTNHPTNHLLYIFKFGAIWNIHTKFQPNRLRNGNFSPFIQTDQLTEQPFAVGKITLTAHFLDLGALWNFNIKFLPNQPIRYRNCNFSLSGLIDQSIDQSTDRSTN